MAAKDSSFYRPEIQPHQGSSVTDLEQMVERVLTTGPFMSLAQLRILLRVEQACEACEATGTVEVRGYYGDHVTQERCDVCKGRGYVIAEKEEVRQ